MVARFWVLGLAMILVVACTDRQVREMAQVGTEGGKPVYLVQTRVRLPATEEKIKQLQDSSIQAQGKRLCPGGFHQVGRINVYEDEYYYNPYGFGWNWDFDMNTYKVLKQDMHIMCNT